MKKIVIPKNILDAMINHLKRSNESKEQFRKAQEKAIQIEHNKTTSRLNELMNMRLDKSITQDEYDEKATELKQRRHELKDQLDRVIYERP